MRHNTATSFLNGTATTLLIYLFRATDLAFDQGDLNEQAQEASTILLLRLMNPSIGNASSYRKVAKRPSIPSKPFNSSQQSIKVIGCRIDHILATFKFGAPVAAAVGGPGGRYDNDFVDFREISILLISDEILSQQPPFLHPSGVLEDPDGEARAQSWPSESCSIHPQARGVYRCRASDDAGGPCGEMPCLGQTKVGWDERPICSNFNTLTWPRSWS
ncbi:hypothetical protein M405DRAFT_939129 [Rhizopogon salebrosus TDB-379]|nr:hypothetical protein M405DRAFT_939129 [Rhizopogon salebrosus TDB-379]